MFIKLFLRTCIQKEKQHIRSSVKKQCIHTNTKESILTISTSQLKHSFKQQCLNVTEGYACIIADCPICNDTKKGSKIYVNKTTGRYDF